MGISLVGHDGLRTLLTDQVAAGSSPAVMIFSGPANVGKRTTALWLAQYNLCSQSDRPCGQCVDCRTVAAHQHTHASFLHPETHKGIEAIRQALNQFSLRPIDNRLRWLIIADIDQYSESALNAVLKFFEEPPAAVQIVVTTDVLDRLPLTIRSRGAIYRFHAVAMDELRSSLRQRYPQLSTPEVHRIAAAALGRPGRAIAAAADLQTWTEHDQTARQWLTELQDHQMPSIDGVDINDVITASRENILQALGVTSRRIWSDMTASTPLPAAVTMATRAAEAPILAAQHVQSTTLLYDLVVA